MADHAWLAGAPGYAPMEPWYQAYDFSWLDDPVAPPSSPDILDAMPSAGPRARDWCFTDNNPVVSAEELTELFSSNSKVKYASWQLERGLEGTPHFQGYVEMTNVATLAAMKKLLPRAHWETRKGSREAARAYSMKEDSRESGPWEFGEWLAPVGQGTRSDLSEVRDLVLAGGKTKRDVLMEFPEVLAKYPRFIDTCLNESLKGTVNPITDFEPRQWQAKVLEMVDMDPDARQVLWVYDPKGNTGKTYLAKYLVQEKGAFYCNGGRNVDLLYAYQGEKIAIFDYVRDSEQYVGYGPIEQIKNGLLFSSKYESGMKSFPVPHVIIFANFQPDRSKMSEDRWCVIQVNQDGDWQSL